MLTSGLLQISLADKAQQTEGHFLSENKVQKVLKSLKVLVGTLIPIVSKSEEQIIKP
jgi:hypothetical protein